MNASSENPYATPVADGPTTVRAAPSPFGWEIADGKLLAEEVALLPMVDPYTGLSSERMTMVRVRVRYRPWWLWIFPTGLPLLALFAQREDRIGAAFFMLTLGLLIRWAAGLVPRPCELRIFVTFRTYQRRRNVGRLLNALFWISMIGSIRLGEAEAAFPIAAQWVFRLWLVSLGLALVFERRLSCRQKRDNLFEIGRVHPAALRELGAGYGDMSSAS